MPIIEQLTEGRPNTEVPNFFEWDNQRKAGTGEQTWEDKITNCSIPGFSFNYELSEDKLTITVNFIYDDFTAMNSFKEHINVSKLNFDADTYCTSYGIQPVFELKNATIPFTVKSVYTFTEEFDTSEFQLLFSHRTLVDLVVETHKFTAVNEITTLDDYTEFSGAIIMCNRNVSDILSNHTVVYSAGTYTPS